MADQQVILPRMSEHMPMGSPMGTIPALRQQWGPSYHRNLSNIPVSPHQVNQLLCPVLTVHNKSIEELTKSDVPDIRAYKLGKKRWSYNQFEIRVQNEIGANVLDVKEALQSSTPPSLQHLSESCASYKVRLVNGLSVITHVFMVYEHALDVVISEGNSVQHTFWQWVCVDRSACKKGCIGPVLRPIQRFGRVGKRSGPEAPKNQAGQLKNYKYMYLSMDEAGTHVGGSRFRLIFCVYDESGSTMLGTTVSVPIRVLANNDVPTGAAHVPINITLRSDWVGWYYPSLMRNLSNPAHLVMARDDAEGDFNVHNGPFGPRYVPNPEPLPDTDEEEDEPCEHGCSHGPPSRGHSLLPFNSLPAYEGEYVPEHFEGTAHDEELAREMGLHPMQGSFGGQMLQPPPPPPLHSHGGVKREELPYDSHLMMAAPPKVATHPLKRRRVDVHAFAGAWPTMGSASAAHTAIERTNTSTSAGLLLPPGPTDWQPTNAEGPHAELQGMLGPSAGGSADLTPHLGELAEGELLDLHLSPRDGFPVSLLTTPHGTGMTPHATAEALGWGEGQQHGAEGGH